MENEEPQIFREDLKPIIEDENSYDWTWNNYWN